MYHCSACSEWSQIKGYSHRTPRIQLEILVYNPYITIRVDLMHFSLTMAMLLGLMTSKNMIHLVFRIYA
jgi:hypothetical protein